MKTHLKWKGVKGSKYENPGGAHRLRERNEIVETNITFVAIFADLDRGAITKRSKVICIQYPRELLVSKKLAEAHFFISNQKMVVALQRFIRHSLLE